MISKQDFLSMVQTEIFPILRQYQEKNKRDRLFTKILSLFSFLMAILCSCLYVCFYHNHNKLVFCIFVVLPFVIGAWILEAYSRYCNRIKSMIRPKIFYLLGLDNNTYFDNPLKEVSESGLVPYFNYEELADSFEGIKIDDTFSVRDTQHSLFVQEVDNLSEERDRNRKQKRRNVFSGIIIEGKQLCPKNFSLLILDKKNEKVELKFGPTSPKIKIQWQKVENKFLNKDFSFYTDNPELRGKHLTPSLLSIIEKLKSENGEPLNILFHNGKIFLAISTKRDLFEYINWEDFSDIEPYVQLYDDIESLHQLDKLLSELENLI